MSTRTMIGILAAGAASLTLTAALGTPAAATDRQQPEAPGCTAALEAVVKAESDAKDSTGPGQRRAGEQITDAEQGEIDKAKQDARAAEREKALNPASPGEDDNTTSQNEEITPSERQAINKAGNDAFNEAHAKAKHPDSDGPFVNDGTVITAEEQAEINTARAKSDAACEGPAGQRGQDGQDGTDGEPGHDGAPAVDGKYGDLGDPQRVIVEHNTQNNYGYPEAPAPIVQSGGDYPAVTG